MAKDAQPEGLIDQENNDASSFEFRTSKSFQPSEETQKNLEFTRR